jgi:hypothetical protein
MEVLGAPLHLCTSSSFPQLTGLRTVPPTTTVNPWSSLCPLVGSPASTMHYSIALKNSSRGIPSGPESSSPYTIVVRSCQDVCCLSCPAPGTASGHRVGELPLGLLLFLSIIFLICHVPITLQLWVKIACMLF